MAFSSISGTKLHLKKTFRFFVKIFIVLQLVTLTAGCVTSGSKNKSSYAKMPLHELEKRYQSTPNNKALAIAYGDELRRAGRQDQAVAVLEKMAIKHPNDQKILTAYGKNLISVGKFDNAKAVLLRAYAADRPDWSILSALGSIEDQNGNTAAAQNFYHEALKIRPNEPSVLSNLGLSYALDKKLVEAEQVLRQAASHPKADARIRANHAMVMELLQQTSPKAQPGTQTAVNATGTTIPANGPQSRNTPKNQKNQKPTVISQPSPISEPQSTATIHRAPQRQTAQTPVRQKQRRIGRYNPADFY